VDDPLLSEDISLGEPLELAFMAYGYGFIALHRPHYAVRPAEGGWCRGITR
jgi:hypothetical protein